MDTKIIAVLVGAVGVLIGIYAWMDRRSMERDFVSLEHEFRNLEHRARRRL